MGYSGVTTMGIADSWYTVGNPQVTNPCGEIFLKEHKRRSAFVDLEVLPKTKYNFSRVKWYMAHIGSNRVTNELMKWSVEHFGLAAYNPDAWSRWYIAWGVFYFRDEKDYILFSLRWL
jgi:hypothetical protein